MDENADKALNEINRISMTVNAGDLEEISRTVMLVPGMTSTEAEDFKKDIMEKGIDGVKSEMGEKEFLIKCFRAAAYFNHSTNPFIQHNL